MTSAQGLGDTGSIGPLIGCIRRVVSHGSAATREAPRHGGLVLHAWENRGDVPAVFASIAMDANPLPIQEGDSQS